MDSQKFCLKWNNFQNSVTSVFDSLRHDEELVDITLCCEGLKIKAHRMMLSACSPYFRDLLKENPCQHPVFFLKDTSYRDLSAVVEFVYKGEVNVAQSQLASFLKTAEMLQVRGLTGDDDDEQVSPTKQSVGGGGDPSGVRRAASQSPMRGRPAPPSSDQPSLSPPPSQPPLKRRRLSADRSPCELPVDTALDDVMDNSGVELSPQPSTAAEPPPLTFHHHQHQQQEHLQQQHHLQSVDPPVKVEKVDLVEDSDLEDESNHSLDAIGAQHMSLFDPSMHHHQLQMHGDESTDQLTGLLRAAGEQGGGMGDMSGGQIPSGVAEDGTPGGFRCELCGLILKNAARLCDHRAVHRGETSCPFCAYVATQKYHLKRHLRVVHGQLL